MEFIMTIVEKARIFATAAHEAAGCVRKYTFEPYIVHPAEVVEILKTVPHTDAMLAAAWLHDVVEDTAVKLDTITVEFGPEISYLVYELTKKSKPEDGPRWKRKQIDRDWLSFVSPEAKTIKLADLISNTKSIVERDPEFAKVYLAEKRELLEILTQGDAVLYEQAAQIF